MITAYQWYNIAQTTTINSSTGVRIEFGSNKILINASIDWANVSISIQDANLSNALTASVRLRTNGIYYYLDIKVNQSFDTNYNIELYDNTFWSKSTSVSNLAGTTLCVIDDILSSGSPSTGESLWIEDENGDLVPKSKADGTPRGIWTYSFLSACGLNPDAGEGGGGGLKEFSIIFNGTRYNSSNGVAIINGNYATTDDIDTTLQGYFTDGIAKEAAKVSNVFKITFNGTSYEYDGSIGKEINFSDLNIVSALGTTPVNRAKADESGNNIQSTYATKTALQDFIDKIEKYFTFGDDNIKANYGFWTDHYLSAGGQNTNGDIGGITEVTAQMITDALGYTPISPSDKLPNPYALVINGQRYDGSSEVVVNINGGVSGDYLPITGGTITGDLSLNQYLRINAWSGYGSGSANVWYNGTTQRLLWENVEDMAFGSKLVLHSGNYSDYALPKSGGTISNSNWGSQLTLNGDGTDAGLKFTNSGNFRGLLYTNNDGRLGWYDMSGADHALIHSGNIGSQSVNYATSAGSANLLRIADIRDTNPNPNTLADVSLSAWFSNIWKPTGATWNSGFTVRGWDTEYAVWQLASSANYGGNTQALYYRLGEGSTWYDWRRLLFNNDDNARFLNSSVVNGKYNTALTLQTNVASRANYQCGLAFNCLGAYSSTYENHTHAWIGLGPVVNTATAEIYPLVFAVNGDTTAGANPIERMRIFPNGNVAIGTTADSGYKLDVSGSTRLMSVITEFNDEINRYGGNLFLQHRGSIAGSQGDARTGHIIMCANGGNVIIGENYDSGDKLQVMGNLRVTKTGDRRSYLNITVSDVQVQYNGWDTGDGYVFHDFFSNGNQIARIDGLDNSIIAYRCMRTPLIEIDVGVTAKSSISSSMGYLSISSISNEMCISGETNDVLYVNYRLNHNGYAPKLWLWKAGSSSSWADMIMGSITAYGNIYASGDITAGSDARYKTRLYDVSVDIDTIANAPLFDFKWNDREDNDIHLGTTAQYWAETAFKHAVRPTNNDKLWTMSYGQIAMANTIVIARKVVNHEERIKQLEKEITRLKKEQYEY